jgi:hypothetical protein
VPAKGDDHPAGQFWSLKKTPFFADRIVALVGGQCLGEGKLPVGDLLELPAEQGAETAGSPALHLSVPSPELGVMRAGELQTA